MSVNKFSIRVDKRKVLRPIEISVLQRSIPDVFQISKVAG